MHSAGWPVEHFWQLSLPCDGSPAGKCNSAFLYSMLSHKQTGRTRMKLAIALTVALLLLLAVPSQASAAGAQSLVLSAPHSQSQSLVGVGVGIPPLGFLWLSALGLLWVRLLSPCLRLLLSAIPLLGLGLRLAPPPLAPLLVNPRQRSMGGRPGQAPALRLAAEIAAIRAQRLCCNRSTLLAWSGRESRRHVRDASG